MQKMTQYHLPTIVLKRLLGLQNDVKSIEKADPTTSPNEVITAPPRNMFLHELRQRDEMNVVVHVP